MRMKLNLSNINQMVKEFAVCILQVNRRGGDCWLSLATVCLDQRNDLGSVSEYSRTLYYVSFENGFGKYFVSLKSSLRLRPCGEGCITLRIIELERKMIAIPIIYSIFFLENELFSHNNCFTYLL